MQDLESLGMKKGLLYETIITTQNRNGVPNAAPIGVICKNKNEIVLNLFEGTHTLENIKANSKFVVNILKDPLVFVGCTTGDLSSDHFKKQGNEFYIKNTDAFFTASVINTKEIEKEDNISKSKMTIIKARVNEVIIKKEGVEPLNRAIFAIIESLVYLTRIKMVDENTAKEYLERIHEMSRTVNRVGSLDHKKAMQNILKYIENDG
ncbi:DUF447 domain-containing protein [Methanobacterium sp.]|jgi:hypothetical protein|uniref:DUF447 domain-containing protein n=1 Tax=Methanobacterium sp. TaxID=2164 RepID=UPI003158A798